MRIRSILAALPGAAFGGVVGGGSVWLLQHAHFELQPQGMSFADFSAILLGAAGLLLTVVGISLAVLGLWGYKEIRSSIIREAKDSATKAADSHMNSADTRKMLETSVNNYLLENLPSLIANVEEGRRKLRDLDDIDRQWEEDTRGPK